MSEIREKMVVSAVKFLLASSPSATAESKVAFLTNKGLTIQECFTAFERAKQKAPDISTLQRPAPLQKNNVIPEVFFTLDQLRQYDGVHRPQIYISLDGIVFDVTESPQFYGVGSNYHVYAGREAGRALGKMTLHAHPTQHQHDLDNPWVRDLNAEAEGVLQDWFRKFSQKYPIVGKIDQSELPSPLSLSSPSHTNNTLCFSPSIASTTASPSAAGASSSSSSPTNSLSPASHLPIQSSMSYLSSFSASSAATDVYPSLSPISDHSSLSLALSSPSSNEAFSSLPTFSSTPHTPNTSSLPFTPIGVPSKTAVTTTAVTTTAVTTTAVTTTTTTTNTTTTGTTTTTTANTTSTTTATTTTITATSVAKTVPTSTTPPIEDTSEVRIRGAFESDDENDRSKHNKKEVAQAEPPKAGFGFQMLEKMGRRANSEDQAAKVQR